MHISSSISAAAFSSADPFSSIGSTSSSSGSQTLLEGALSQLAAAVRAGDMEQAKRYLIAVRELSASSAGVSNRLSQSLSILSNDLSRNDVAEAQSTVQALVRSTVELHAPAATPGPQPDAGSNAVAQPVADLSASVLSGNLKGAQSAYEALRKALGKDSGSSSVASGSPDAFLATHSPEGSLAAIGNALDAGDLTSARVAHARFLQSVSAGLVFSAQA